MDWTMVVERNGKALRRILAMLVAMAGLDSAAALTSPTLPRHLHRAILCLLRPAEAAARRLVIVAARGLVVPLPPALRATSPAAQGMIGGDERTPKILSRLRGMGTAAAGGSSRLGGGGAGLSSPVRRPTLPLFDRLNLPRERRPTLRSIPRITAIGYSVPSRIAVRLPPTPNDPLDARRLLLRLQAIGRALDDLPGHARRFARWRAARDAAVAQMKENAVAASRSESQPAADPPLRSGGGGRNGRRGQPPRPRRFTRIWPLRPGRPPGSRLRPTHEVHEVLADLQYFAFHALKQRTDSS